MSLLDVIVEAARERIEARKRDTPLSAVKAAARDAEPVRSLYDALLGRPLSVIAEHKRKSPSLGLMDQANCDQAFDVYARHDWIAAVSVLTDEDHFDGKLEDLTQGRQRTKKPILRKDFIIDEYQVWEARARGADAILLMAALHIGNAGRLADLHALARELGMDALMEIGMHRGDPDVERRIVPKDARIWGINSREFKGGSSAGRVDLSVDRSRHAALRDLIPEGCVAVAESGIHTVEHLAAVRDARFHAALIGTAFVQGPRPIADVADELAKAFAVATP